MGFGLFRNEDDTLGLEYEPGTGKRQVYLRRLSGSYDSGRGLLLEDLDKVCGGQDDNGNNSIVRPAAVLTRIKQLNLNAKAFADTILALQQRQNGDCGGRAGRRCLAAPRSLQHSPSHSCSMISLMDIDRSDSFASRTTSTENLADDSGSFCHNTGLSRHASRRSLSRRSLANSVVSLTQEQQEEMGAETERLLEEREEELRRRLRGFETGRSRELTPYEAKSLVALLHSKDTETLKRTLVTISNCAAFTRNQDELRESGCLMRLQSLLAGSGRDVRLAAVAAAANLALNTGNMKEMEYYVPLLASIAEDESRESDKELLVQALLALTNIAVLPDWHHQYRVLLPRLHELWSKGSEAVTLQVLKLLINLSCNDELVPAILSAKVPGRVTSLVSPVLSEELLLRSTRLLSNLAVSGARLGLTSHNNDLSLQHRLFGLERGAVIQGVGRIMEEHRNMDIRLQARKVHVVLAGLQ